MALHTSMLRYQMIACYWSVCLKSMYEDVRLKSLWLDRFDNTISSTAICPGFESAGYATPPASPMLLLYTLRSTWLSFCAIIFLSRLSSFFRLITYTPFGRCGCLTDYPTLPCTFGHSGMTDLWPEWPHFQKCTGRTTIYIGWNLLRYLNLLAPFLR